MDEPDLSAIGTDVPAKIKITDMAKREELQIVLDRDKEMHDFALRIQDRDLGKIGQLFGSRENAITYIVAFFALMSIVLIALFCWGNASLSNNAIEFFKAIGFASVGFITGKSLGSSEKKD